ncbi:hypothetical protein QBC32DRAFT_340003 [Pseudoneurospora amorphoporcata]|uniref:Succinate dehydrogenase assembly factor 4, mitochondrial n=1 Tax=Pseudoneurospora amorphoporcata TaxID=241081 RepID=A0AAN6NXV9_9PEZI|nr:hypothetical protein QBC32DRAFT_340003 [Pseudoneurospora amorphoporcata]
MSRRLLTLTRPISGLPKGLPATTTRYYSSSFLQRGPAPPRLPAAQQAEFERLQAAAEAALYTHTTIPNLSQQNPATPASPENNPKHVTEPAGESTVAAQTQAPVIEDAAQTFSGGIRKGAPPEFEGDVNPKTGEVGGPKNEPLRWGASGDWSFNGRVTDF